MTSSAGAPAAVVTPTRSVDRPSLDTLAAAVEGVLVQARCTATPLGIWVDDAVDFAACVLAALAVRAQAFVVPPAAAVSRVEELCAIEGGAAVLCDEARSRQLAGRTRVACGPGLVLVSTQPPAPGDYDQGALHFFTSGTDGRPKGVVRTQESLALEESVVGAHLGMGPGSTVLCAVPPSHGYGYTAGLFAPLSLGGTAVLAGPRLPASLAKLLVAHRPVIVVAVPAQYAAWSTLRRAYDGPVPRLWLCGGAPLPAAVRARFTSTWGGVIAEQYGMTETGAVSVDLDGTETLGRPYPGVTVTIDDGGAETGLGEVVVDAPYGPRGYLGGEAADGSGPFTPHGFRSGDTGWRDGGDRLHLVGRRAHQLNVRGRQVDPAEVERALWSVDGVRDVAVIGVDRDEGDQWIAAFVVCADAVGDETLHQATDGLEAFKRPQRLTRLPEIPKTATGADYDALRALVRSGSRDG